MCHDVVYTQSSLDLKPLNASTLNPPTRTPLNPLLATDNGLVGSPWRKELSRVGLFTHCFNPKAFEDLPPDMKPYSTMRGLWFTLYAKANPPAH